MPLHAQGEGRASLTRTASDVPSNAVARTASPRTWTIDGLPCSELTMISARPPASSASWPCGVRRTGWRAAYWISCGWSFGADDETLGKSCTRGCRLPPGRRQFRTPRQSPAAARPAAKGGVNQRQDRGVAAGSKGGTEGIRAAAIMAWFDIGCRPVQQQSVQAASADRHPARATQQPRHGALAASAADIFPGGMKSMTVDDHHIR